VRSEAEIKELLQRIEQLIDRALDTRNRKFFTQLCVRRKELEAEWAERSGETDDG